MKLYTTENINQKYEVIGMVMGSTVRSRNVFSDFGAGVKSVVGGKLKGYQKLLIKTRQEINEIMIEEAKQIGADAIVMVRYSSSTIAQGASELFVYGTAVKFK